MLTVGKNVVNSNSFSLAMNNLLTKVKKEMTN